MIVTPRTTRLAFGTDPALFVPARPAVRLVRGTRAAAFRLAVFGGGIAAFALLHH